MEEIVGRVFTANRKAFGRNVWPNSYYYCGRAMPQSGYKGAERDSILANKHRVVMEENRGWAIRQFRSDLVEDWKAKGPMYQEIYRLAEMVAQGRDITLVCWCKPKDCHTDIIKRGIESIVKEILEAGRANDDEQRADNI